MVLFDINIIIIFANDTNQINNVMKRVFKTGYKDADGHFVLEDEITEPKELKIKFNHPFASAPDYAYDGESVGLDMYGASVKYIPEKDCFCYDTGVAIELNDDEVAFVVPNSRNRNTEYYIPNSPGVVDPGYRGSIMFNYKNRLPRYVSRIFHFFEDVCNKLNLLEYADKLNELNKAMQMPYKLEFKDGKAVTCIGQLIICKIQRKNVVVAQELSPSKRMANGHGSTVKIVGYTESTEVIKTDVDLSGPGNDYDKDVKDYAK